MVRVEGDGPGHVEGRQEVDHIAGGGVEGGGNDQGHV